MSSGPPSGPAVPSGKDHNQTLIGGETKALHWLLVRDAPGLSANMLGSVLGGKQVRLAAATSGEKPGQEAGTQGLHPSSVPMSDD